MRCHEPPISTSHYPYLLPNTNKHEKSKSERCLRARILWLRKRGAGRTSSSRAAVRQHPCSSPRTRRHIARKRWPKVMPLPILPPIACCRSHSPHQHQSLCVSHSQAVKHTGEGTEVHAWLGDQNATVAGSCVDSMKNSLFCSRLTHTPVPEPFLRTLCTPRVTTNA